MSRFLRHAVYGAEREVVVRKAGSRTSDRLDLLLSYHSKPVAAIEVKVLSDLGIDQLDRYDEAFPAVKHRGVLHLDSLPVGLEASSGWQSLSWEHLLDAYTLSTHPWVAMTASAWLEQLGSLVPQNSPVTVWNDVPDDPAGLELALRARIAWLAHGFSGPGLTWNITQSSGGGAWVLRAWASTSLPDLQVQLEVQEGLNPIEWQAAPDAPYRDRLRGPAPLVGLRLSNVDSSARFDWELLRQVFATHVFDDHGSPRPGFPWQTSSASPRNPVDRANWRTMVDAGGPRWVGKGFGMAVAQQRRYRECLFGARMQLRPDMELGTILTELTRIGPLLTSITSSVDAARLSP